MPSKAFISYASQDRAVADRLCYLLEERGVSCWIAPRDVRPGFDWDEAILDAIANAPVFLVILSRYSNDSVHVKHEVERAASKGKHIIVLRIENLQPSRKLELHISSRHWLNAWDDPLESRADAIVQSIAEFSTTDAASVATDPGSPERPVASPVAGSFDLAMVRLGAGLFAFNREEFIVEGLQHVRDGTVPFLLLQGLGGIGKTVLLRELARRLRPDFPYFVSIRFDGPAAIEPSFVLEEVNGVLSSQGRGYAPREIQRFSPPRLMEMLIARMVGLRILFLLDALDTVSVSFLENFLGCLPVAGRGMCCIMTARSRLQISAPFHLLTIPPLSDTEVLEFISEYGKIFGQDIDASGLASSLPQGLRSHPQALSTILSNLRDLPLELLRLVGLPEEARIPSALIEQVVRSLDATQRECLAFMRVLSNVDLSCALREVLAMPPDGLAQSLKALISKSLVYRSGPEYSVPAIVREGLSIVDPEVGRGQANLVAKALSAAIGSVGHPQDIKPSLPGICAQIALNLYEDGRFDLVSGLMVAELLEALNQRGFWKEYCLMLRLGVEAAIRCEDRKLAVELRLRLARKSLQTYELVEGRAALAAVEEMIGPEGDTTEHAELYSHRANFSELSGDPHLALTELEKSRCIRRAHNDTAGLALLDKLSGNIHLRLKDYVSARKEYESSVHLLADLSHLKGALEAEMGLALCDLEDGLLESAEVRLREVVKRCRGSGFEAGVPQARYTLALVLERLGRIDEALGLACEAAAGAKTLDPSLASAAAMLVWRLENVTSMFNPEDGHGQHAGV
jgi:tetratricopeptide (TPR) repeat protein